MTQPAAPMPPPLRAVQPEGPRLPDHALDAEAAVLSSVLLDPRTLASLPRLEAKHFFDRRHQLIFAAILALTAQGAGVDTTTVSDFLRTKDRLREAGGNPYLARIVDATPAVAHVEDHAQIVVESWQVRQLAKACHELLARTSVGEVAERRALLDDAQRKIGEASADLFGGRSGALIGDAIRERMVALSNAPAGGHLAGLPTGFAALDAMTGGLRSDRFWVLAARPGRGKSALALQLAANVAGDGGGAMVFSLEMSRPELVDRLLCSRAKVDGQRFAAGRADAYDWERLSEAAHFLQTCPLWIDAEKGLRMADIRSRALHQAAVWARDDRKVDLVVLDYVQLVRPSPGPATRTREREVADISRACKELAGALGCTVLGIASMNRAIEKGEREPHMSDLRESGALEFDADLLAFLWGQKSTPKGVTELLLKKHRGGPTGRLLLRWTPWCTRFDDFEEVGRGAADFERDGDA